MTPIVIAHLYPAEMNIYGDLGNIIALRRRLEWRGYATEVRAVEPGQAFDFASADIVFGGGGQDSGQLRIGADLVERGPGLRAAVADGLPLLVVCGLYQLLGHGFVTDSGQTIEGVGVFEATTRASGQRMIGNIVVESAFGRLVGFENHSGQTELVAGQAPLGKVKSGFGNNSRSGFEGAVTGNAIGTYLHGPVLPKNPALADHLIAAALRRRGVTTPLTTLDGSVEQAAATSAAKRPQ